MGRPMALQPLCLQLEIKVMDARDGGRRKGVGNGQERECSYCILKQKEEGTLRMRLGKKDPATGRREKV